MIDKAWFAGLGLLATATAVAASDSSTCPLAPPALQKANVQVAWQVAGQQSSPAITVGRHFAIEIQLCPVGATLLRVDAHMPEHRHGMNYRPSLKQLAPNRWRAEGLLFHMPGQWEVVFDLQESAPAGGQTVPRITLRERLVLP